MPGGRLHVLKTRGLSKSFPGVRALEQVDLEILQGEVHALCGENGAGKSTLIKTLSGIWPYGSYEGQIFLNEKETHFQNLAEAEKEGISVIYQELALVPELTVAENIFLGDEPRKGLLIDNDTLLKESHEWIERFNLDLDPTVQVKDLGTGKQQMVEIVKALRKEGKVLILDEPSAALTESEVKVLLGIVKDLKKKGITCIYISHKLDEVFEVSDRLTVLRDGRTVVTLDKNSTTQSEVIRHMVGREISELYPDIQKSETDAVLEVENLTVSEGEKKVLENVSFSLRAGEVLGVGGLMGSGRTELLMHLMGAFGTRVQGKVRVNGNSVCFRNPREAIDAGVVLVSEDRKELGLHLEQSISFNLSLSSLDQISSVLLDENHETIRNNEMSSRLKVRSSGLDAMVGTLSGGNQQKVVLGKALLCAPKVVLLDEPTRGIDVGAKAEVYSLIEKLCGEGMAVLLVSSELPELMGLSSHLLILAEGRVGGAFAKGEASQEDLLASAIGSDSKESKTLNEEVSL